MNEYKLSASRVTIIAEAGVNHNGSIDIAKITIFLTEEPSERSLIGESNRKHFPYGPPAMSWIRVAGLFRPEVKVEVEAIAAVD